MENKFKTPKTSSLIANDIKLKIIRGELKAGEFLPPETQLMVDLGISRPTLREAFRILEEQRLVEITRGSRSGAKILTPNIDIISEDIGAYLQFQKANNADIYYSRLGFEPFIVEQLAGLQDKSFTKILRQKCENLKTSIDRGDYRNYPKIMAQFHFALAQSYGNKTMEAISRIVTDLVLNHQIAFQARVNQSPETMRKRFLAGYKSCLKLLSYIEASDANAATEHWKLHLTNVTSGWAIRDEGIRVFENFNN
jgi:DNA-binding FadR family transcriptional regulator